MRLRICGDSVTQWPRVTPGGKRMLAGLVLAFRAWLRIDPHQLGPELVTWHPSNHKAARSSACQKYWMGRIKHNHTLMIMELGLQLSLLGKEGLWLPDWLAAHVSYPLSARIVSFVSSYQFRWNILTVLSTVTIKLEVEHMFTLNFPIFP